jgi:hypothetical protein
VRSAHPGRVGRSLAAGLLRPVSLLRLVSPVRPLRPVSLFRLVSPVRPLRIVRLLALVGFGTLACLGTLVGFDAVTGSR